MRKTKLIANGMIPMVVSHPDWTEQELQAKMRQVVKDIATLAIIEDPTEEFPDLEFGEHGERLLSFVDFLNM
jgi:hypothetical protein